MDWIKKIDSEIKQKQKTNSFVKDNFETVINELFDFVKIALEEVKDSMIEIGLGESFNLHTYKNDNESGFWVAADPKSSNKSISMFVFFIANNLGESKNDNSNDFIRIERELWGENPRETLSEIIAVRFDQRKRTTFEPEIFNLQGSSEIGDETLKRLLIEPVIRKYLGLPQESYQEGFAL